MTGDSLPRPERTTWETVLSGAHDTNEYTVYAVYDEHGDCAYVGRSKRLSQRFRRHLSDATEIGSYVAEIGCDLPVDLYSLSVADDIIMTVHEKYPPENLSAKRHADGAEIEMCQILKPYLNRRLTYATQIDQGRALLAANDFTPEMFIRACAAELRRYNVTEVRFREEMEAYARGIGMEPDESVIARYRRRIGAAKEDSEGEST